MKKFKSLWLALILISCLPLVVWGAFPSALTNAVDGVTEIFASHLNNMEAKVGVDNSSVATSLDYMLRHSGSIDPGHKHTPPYGGTGIYTYAIGDLLYASSTSALSRLADVATGNALISGGVGAAPAWGKVALTTHISGVLPVANGGTNIATYAVGDLLYASTTGILTKLPDVATGSALISGGVGVAPAYGKIGLTTHVSGVLPVANGGTNISSYAVGDILYASGATTLSKLADVAAGSVLVSGGVTTAPAWSATPLVTSISIGTANQNLQKINTVDLQINAAETGANIIFRVAGAERMRIASDGGVTMANYGAGTATFDASGRITSVSDERLKTIQGKYTVGLKELMGIQPINYKWNKKSGMEMKHTYAGFSAQNIQKVMPEAVYENKEGTLSFNDRAVLAAAVNAIKELNAKVVALEAKVKRLEGKIK